MNHITGFRLGTLAVLITAASVLAWPEPTYAQTQGMGRRDERRDGTAVIKSHAGPVRVEYSRDANIQLPLAVVLQR